MVEEDDLFELDMDIKDHFKEYLVVPVKTKNEVMTCCRTLYSENIVPVINVSNVTLEGFDLLLSLLHSIPPNPIYSEW